MSEEIILTGDKNISESITEYKERVIKFANQDIVIDGIPTGIPKLDETTQGIQKKDLWVVHGRTGLGKTWFVSYLASHMRDHGYNILFINREMEPKYLMGRIWSLSAQFSYARWRAGKLKPEEMIRYAQLEQKLKKCSGIVNAVPPIKHLPISKIKQIVLECDPQPNIVIVDYVNRISPENGSYEVYSSSRNIAEGLKELAYNYEIPVIAVAQTNRSAVLMNKKERIPGTEHIWGADTLAWNADLVLSLYQTKKMRDEYELGAQVVKYRHGEQINVILDWRITEGIIKFKKIGEYDVIDDNE